MALDQKKYETEVVRPLRTRITDLPDDLTARYAIEPGFSTSDLERRLREVRAYWNNKARSTSSIGQVCAAFLRADEKLKAEHGESALLDPAWWQRRQADRDRARPAAIAALVADLRSSQYSDLGALTEEQLSGVAGSHGDMSSAEVARAAATAGLRVVAVRELPRDSGVDEPTFRAISTGIIEAGATSIPTLLHPGCTAFTLLDAFRATPSTAGGLDLAAVDVRVEALNRSRDGATSGPTKNVLGRLRTAAAHGTDLRRLALVHVLQVARARRDAGATPSGVVQALTRLGILQDEARILTVHLLAEGVTERDPLDEFRALLTDGRPVAAGRLLASLPATSATEAKELLDRRLSEIEAYRSEAHKALADHRPDVAEQKLRAAVDLAVDRPDLAEELAALPPASVRAVSVAPDGAGVRIGWTPATTHRDDIVYRIVRRFDRAPADAADGQVVGDVRDAHVTIDAAPPVGRTLHYAILAARRTEGPWSAPVVGTVLVVPPISDLELVGEPNAVVGRWTAHPDAVRVAVRRFDRPPGPGVPGTEMRSATGSFTDATVRPGAEHHYEFVAVYAAPAGRGELTAEPVVGRSGVLAEAAPVSTLNVTADDDDLEPHVVLRWRTPPGADVEVRVGRTPPPGEFGERLPHAEVEVWGSAIAGVPRVEADWTGLRTPAPSGRVWFAAFTRRPDARVRGQEFPFEFVPPPRGLHAQRRGEVTVLSWVWPENVRVAEVRWANGRGRVTQARYRDDGGYVLPAGVHGTIEVRTVADGSASSPLTTTIEAPRRSVVYTVRTEGSRLRGTRECVVSLRLGEGVDGVEIRFVAAPGRTMPLIAKDEDVLAEGRLVGSGELRVPYPRLRRPFWFRCFSAQDDVVLVDPPVSELKVS